MAAAMAATAHVGGAHVLSLPSTTASDYSLSRRESQTLLPCRETPCPWPSSSSSCISSRGIRRTVAHCSNCFSTEAQRSAASTAARHSSVRSLDDLRNMASPSPPSSSVYCVSGGERRRSAFRRWKCEATPSSSATGARATAAKPARKAGAREEEEEVAIAEVGDEEGKPAVKKRAEKRSNKSTDMAAMAAAATKSRAEPEAQNEVNVVEVVEKETAILDEGKQEERRVSQSNTFQRKTKIVCTIGPTCNSKEMILQLVEEGMNIARLNMSHGEHQWHKAVVNLIREYNETARADKIGIMLDTKGPEVRTGDVPQPIPLEKGQEFTFTIKRGVGSEKCVSVNYDGFVDDVEVGDIVLIDGGMQSLAVKRKTTDSVICEVVDGGDLTSRRHVNVRGKSATLPSITEKDWEDIKFGVENEVDFYALSFVKSAEVVLELKAYLKSKNADIKVLVKIESADSIPNLHTILEASDGAMVARGDLGAELPVEEVPILQNRIIQICRSMVKPVIVATNMLESMINHPTPTRAEVSDIAIAVREGADAVMLSGETAHGKYPLKAVRVMHTVAFQTEGTMLNHSQPTLGPVVKNHMSEMFAFHSAMMANTLGASVIVFTRSGSMAHLLSHYRPNGVIFTFTNDKRVQQRLSLWRGVRALHMEFSEDAEETFKKALARLLECGMVEPGEEVALVQSGRTPIWRSESTHHIQVRTVHG